MPLLIDGYNLLHASDIVGEGPGRTSLDRSRRALLEFLAGGLSEKELAETTIVFDAAGAPPGLPRHEQHAGISIQFAPRDEDADIVIERLIEENHDPRRLTVVSSDHRIQRAARRRKATYVDSDVWFRQIIREKQQRPATPREAKPTGPVSDAEVKHWMREFSDDE